MSFNPYVFYGGDCAEAEYILPRGTILDRPWAGRVTGEVAADGTDGGAGRIRWPEETVGGGGLLYL